MLDLWEIKLVRKKYSIQTIFQAIFPFLMTMLKITKTIRITRFRLVLDNVTEEYSEPIQTSKMEPIANIVNG